MFHTAQGGRLHRTAEQQFDSANRRPSPGAGFCLGLPSTLFLAVVAAPPVSQAAPSCLPGFSPGGPRLGF